MQSIDQKHSPRVSRVSRLVSRLRPGILIDESCGSAETLNLRTIELAREFGAKLGRLPSKRSEDFDQIVSEMGDSAVDHLNTLPGLLPYCSFMFEDNSLFFTPDLESAKESVEFVSCKDRAAAERHGMECDPDDPSFPAPSFRGEWLHVSDHGNATLYVREDAPYTAASASLVGQMVAGHVAPYRDRELWGIV